MALKNKVFSLAVNTAITNRIFRNVASQKPDRYQIIPCVFVPFYQDNVNELYAEGKTLANGVHSKLMKNGRKWQHEYGFENGHHRENILMPCSIKDNFDNFRKNAFLMKPFRKIRKQRRFA